MSGGAGVTSVGVAVISWPGFEDNAARIASQVQGHSDVVHVLHNSDRASLTQVSDSWINFPPDAYFGPKFSWAIENIDTDVLLFIVADTNVEQWGKLVKRCGEAFRADPDIAVWAPLITETWWNMEKIQINHPARNDGSFEVVAVDSIVWAVSSELVSVLKTLDYSKSRFGWGIEVTSAAIARCQEKLVVCDPALQVSHRRGTTYSTELAMVEAEQFYAQLSPAHRAMVSLIEEFALLKTVATPVTVMSRIQRGWGYLRDLVYRLTVKRLSQWRGTRP